MVRSRIRPPRAAIAAGFVLRRPRPTAKFNAQEQDVVEFFKKEGKKVYAPDVAAFRSLAQKKYVEKYGRDWPKGALERISAVK